MYRELEVAKWADLDDAARGRLAPGSRPDQQPRHLLDRPLRGREADALEPAAGERVEPLEREREVRAPLVGGDGMDLVDDHGPPAGEERAAAFGREQVVAR